MFEKMSIGELTLHVGQLLVAYSKEGVYPAHICIWHNKLKIHFVGHTNIQHPTFLKFTRSTYEHGLSYDAWKKLATSIYNYVRRNEPCQKQSKH